MQDPAAAPGRGPWLQPPVPVRDPVIVAVAADKGGVGKTTLALELAAAIGAVLVDLDWSRGGSTRAWGARPAEGIIRALDGGPAPRVRSAGGRCDLVPRHDALAEAGWRPEAVADALERWAREWDRPLVVDTHPGVGDLAFGAMAAAHVVVVPVELAERELDGLEGMLELHPEANLVLAPNMVPRVPPARQLRRLEELATAHHRLVAPPVSAYTWLCRRARRSALVLSPPTQATARAVRELVNLALTVRAALPERG